MNAMIRYQQTGSFDAVYRKYHRLVFWRLRRILPAANQETLAELTQDVFVKVVRYRERYNAKFKPSTWIARIARGVALDWRRRSRLTPGELPKQIAARRDDRDIWEAVDRLPEPQRQVVRAVCHDRLSLHETAALLSVPYSRVHSHWHDALDALRREVTP